MFLLKIFIFYFKKHISWICFDSITHVYGIGVTREKRKN
jgi:hypothetical protein